MKKKRIKKIALTTSKIWKIIREVIKAIVDIIIIYEFIDHIIN